jgi:hypothetical protein
MFPPKLKIPVLVLLLEYCRFFIAEQKKLVNGRNGKPAVENIICFPFLSSLILEQTLVWYAGPAGNF